LINQTPIQEKPNTYIRKIKTVQFIYIIEKVGLINQAPTEEESKSHRTIKHLGGQVLFFASYLAFLMHIKS
jgi:hypothetical protein